MRIPKNLLHLHHDLDHPIRSPIKGNIWILKHDPPHSEIIRMIFENAGGLCGDWCGGFCIGAFRSQEDELAFMDSIDNIHEILEEAVNLSMIFRIGQRIK